jgi:hypothetical protein
LYFAALGVFAGGWRKLHNEELNNLYSLSITTIIEGRKMR